MRPLILDPLPAEVEALLVRRRECGADRHDEVWEGVLHMSHPPSSRHDLIVMHLIVLLAPLAAAKGIAALGAAGIGVKNDHRVPDMTLLRPPVAEQWQPTAALAVEVLSLRDSAWSKLGFYAARGVDEGAIVDPEQRKVDWLQLRDGDYVAVQRSAVIELGPGELAARLDWDQCRAQPD
jgi:Uma2 family endonuclease